MRVLLLGGTSFIGPAVVRILAEQGHFLTLFHRGRTTTNLPPGVTILRGDRNNLGSHVEVLRATKPDVVVDMICFTKPDAADLVQVFSGHAGRAVVLSSCDVYRQFGGLIGIEEPTPDGTPLQESAPLRQKRYPFRTQAKYPGDFNYAYEKLDVEETLRGSSLPTCLLRLPVVYGEGDKQRRLAGYVKLARSGAGEIVLEAGHAAQRITRGYVGNMAAAVALAVTNGASAGQTYNVADEVTLREGAFAEAVVRAAGSSAVVRAGEAREVAGEMRYPGDARYGLEIDSSAIRRELGYRDAVGLEEGVRRAVEWEMRVGG